MVKIPSRSPQSKIGSRHAEQEVVRLVAYVTGSVNQELLIVLLAASFKRLYPK
jgi:hypothetical protein